eukprot:99695_1
MASKMNQTDYAYHNINQTIQMTDTKEINNFMEEKDTTVIQLNVVKQDFMQPIVNDYDVCDNDIVKCNAMQRIMHLLQYYDQFKESSNHAERTVPLYEYISSMDNYSISTFMQDWYHSKTKHFKQEKDYTWFKLNYESSCATNDNTKTCAHTQRYQRIRGREIYNISNDIDHKNIILRDQIDSIHTYIFHSPTSTE